MYTVCIFLLCSGDKGTVDATHQLIGMYVLIGWPPWPLMKAFTMFAEPLAAFARVLLFLRSAFDATAQEEEPLVVQIVLAKPVQEPRPSSYSGWAVASHWSLS